MEEPVVREFPIASPNTNDDTYTDNAEINLEKKLVLVAADPEALVKLRLYNVAEAEVKSLIVVVGKFPREVVDVTPLTVEVINPVEVAYDTAFVVDETMDARVACFISPVAWSRTSTILSPIVPDDTVPK